MKNLFKISSLLIALLFTPIAQSEPLSAFEKAILDSWIAYPEERGAIADYYWKDVANQIRDLEPQLPIKVAPDTYIVGIVFKPGFTRYVIVFPNEQAATELIPSKQDMAVSYCRNPRTILYMVTFGGVTEYVHYIQGQEKPHSIVTIDANDCVGT